MMGEFDAMPRDDEGDGSKNPIVQQSSCVASVVLAQIVRHLCWCGCSWRAAADAAAAVVFFWQDVGQLPHRPLSAA
jgi:hypothetical protein